MTRAPGVIADIEVRGRELYRALADADVKALRRLLSSNFQGELTAGLPNGLGRRYEGLDAMMSEGWAKVGRLFEMSPQPERLINGGDVLIGLGAYVGVAKPTGKAVRAAFAHFWSWNGGQFTGVRQVTDSGAWRDALLA